MAVMVATAATEVMVSGEHMPDSERTNQSFKGISKNIVGILAIVVIAFSALFFYFQYVNYTPSDKTYEPAVEMQHIISNCVSEKVNTSDILPFLEDKIESCEINKDKNQCESNYYILNAFGGIYLNNCNDLGNTESNIFCESLKNNDVSNCEKLQTQLKRFVCKAVISKDIYYCNTLTNEQDQKICRNMFYVQKGILSKNMNECENIEEIEDVFEYSFSQKEWCQSVVSKNASLYIQKIEDQCNDNLVGMLNKKLCYILGSQDKIQDCLDRIDGIFACINESNPKSCISNLIHLSFFCNLPNQKLTQEDLYYGRYIFLKENPNICPQKQ